MYQAEDNRRKTNSTNNLKTAFGTNSHNSLLSALDKKRSDVSKEKYQHLYVESKSIICPNKVIILIPKVAQLSIFVR